MMKLTKSAKFEMLKDLLAKMDCENRDMLVEFVDHELELLARKNSTKGDRKPTKTQTENIEYIELIEQTLTNSGEAMTINDIIQANPTFVDMNISNQKMSALLKKLVDSQKVEKFVEKKKTYFKICK